MRAEGYRLPVTYQRLSPSRLADMIRLPVRVVKVGIRAGRNTNAVVVVVAVVLLTAVCFVREHVPNR